MGLHSACLTRDKHGGVRGGGGGLDTEEGLHNQDFLFLVPNTDADRGVLGGSETTIKEGHKSQLDEGRCLMARRGMVLILQLIMWSQAAINLLLYLFHTL